MNDKCYVTNAPAEISDDLRGRDLRHVESSTCGRYIISRDLALSYLHNKLEQKDAVHVMAGVLRGMSRKGEVPELGVGNYEAILDGASVPNGPLEKIDRLVQYVYEETEPGREAELTAEKDYPLVYARDARELHWLMQKAQELGYVSGTFMSSGASLSLDLKGWQRIDELRGSGFESKQAFVAMWFSEDVRAAWEDGIKPALTKAGWSPLRIDMKEHNDRIDAEIIAEIRRSGILVADVTGQRAGVYFEAGFALGLDIPVIWTCREDEIEKVHFDTRQYNHVLWSGPEDLHENLYYRVTATAPLRLRER